MSCKNDGKDGICTGCREWTGACDETNCCGVRVAFEGGFISPDNCTCNEPEPKEAA